MTLLIAAAVSGCGGGSKAPTPSVGGAEQAPVDARSKTVAIPRGSEPVHLDPSTFTSQIDNPYWPMRPGNHWTFRETDGHGADKRVNITVTDKTRNIMGIEARVVHDVLTEDGQVAEDTYDWYAQDADGKGKVPHGPFDHALLTKDFTPLEPEVVEHKYYVQGVGPVLAITVSGGADREELLRFELVR